MPVNTPVKRAPCSPEHPQLAVFVRVNAFPTEWFADDIARGVPAGAIGVVVPKIESAAQVGRVGRALDRGGFCELSILAGIETVAGVINVAEILYEPRFAACYFGAEDYTADLGTFAAPTASRCCGRDPGRRACRGRVCAVGRPSCH